MIGVVSVALRVEPQFDKRCGEAHMRSPTAALEALRRTEDGAGWHRRWK